MRNRGTPKKLAQCPDCKGFFRGKAMKHHRCPARQTRPEPGEEAPPPVQT